MNFHLNFRNEQFGRGTQEDSYELLNTVLSGIFDEIINNADVSLTSSFCCNIFNLFRTQPVDTLHLFCDMHCLFW